MSEATTKPSKTWLERWEPNDEAFWQDQGRRFAWRTLILTTASLVMAFIVWFVISALVVRLPNAGFDFTSGQLFWLASMPGLAGGTLRVVHTFLTPIFGTRHVVTFSTLSLLIPLVGWFFAVQNPETPFWLLMVLAFLAGLGGGNFSSFMPSTSLFFPKRLQGTALAIQAGVGNFGVSIVQFLTPWVIGFALFGSIFAAPQTGPDGEKIWLHNALLIYIPFVVVLSALCWLYLRSVPLRANFREQLDIFELKHGLIMTILYIMTFGSFAGLSATFPLLIKESYGGFSESLDPLLYAFIGPLIGSAMRVAGGPLSDRFGGAKVTQFAGIGMLVCAIGVSFFLTPDSMDSFPLFLGFMLGIFFFSGIGNASTFKQMPMLFPARQAAGVIGWTSAMAAYGPFAMGMFFGVSLSLFGRTTEVFYLLATYYAACILINWWYYARRNAPNPC
ncbi:MFS transporter [Fodinicurvata halophila]|uniref:MFS transporter n=2 Tax=Fodinicurvata halophila TaxID=1419723 RepID=A0ABV8UPV5_9PROT